MSEFELDALHYARKFLHGFGKLVGAAVVVLIPIHDFGLIGTFVLVVGNAIMIRIWDRAAILHVSRHGWTLVGGVEHPVGHGFLHGHAGDLPDGVGA